MIRLTFPLNNRIVSPISGFLLTISLLPGFFCTQLFGQTSPVVLTSSIVEVTEDGPILNLAGEVTVNNTIGGVHVEIFLEETNGPGLQWSPSGSSLQIDHNPGPSFTAQAEGAIPLGEVPPGNYRIGVRVRDSATDKFCGLVGNNTVIVPDHSGPAGGFASGNASVGTINTSGGYGMGTLNINLLNAEADNNFGPGFDFSKFNGVLLDDSLGGGLQQLSEGGEQVAAKYENSDRFDIGNFQQQSHGEADHSYEILATFYRKDASETSRTMHINARLTTGMILSIPFTVNFTGDVKADAGAPTVSAARWMTKGEDPTYLDIFPLSGRSANTQVFVQVDLSDDTLIAPFGIVFYLDNPLLIPGSFPAIGFGQNLKGDFTSGTFGGSIYVRNDIDWTAWEEGVTATLKAIITDIYGQVTTHDVGDVCFYGPKGILPDLVPPEIVSSSINDGQAVTITGEENFQEFPVSAVISDAGKGFSHVSMSYSSPSGFDFVFLSFDPFSLTEGTTTFGTVSSTPSVGKYFEPGIYTLVNVFLRDKAGNFVTLNPEELPEAVQKTFEVINPFADIAFPTLESPVLITPSTTADVTSDSVELTFTFTLKDVGTGIQNGGINLYHCSDSFAQWLPGVFFSPSSGDTLVSGDASEGTYAVKVTIPAGQTSGDYGYQISASDVAGRTRNWGKVIPFRTPTADPLPNGSDEIITVISPDAVVDETGPVLTNIALVCDFDLADDEGIMNVTLSFENDITPLLDFGGSFGPGSNFIRLTSPTGATRLTQTFGAFDLTSGDLFNGTVNFDVFFPKGSEPGDYCVEVQMTNSANVVSTYGLGFGELTFPSEFPGVWPIVNTGVVDCAPPIPIELTVTPGFATVGTDVTLNVSLRITDAGMGLQFGSFNLLNGISEQFGFRSTLFSTTLNDPAFDENGTGTINDVTYTFEIPLTGDQFSGDFLSFRMLLTDCAQNSRQYDSSICEFNFSSWPLPFHIVQIGTDGNDDPVITSDGGGETAMVNAEEGQTSATTVTATDTDFPPDQLIFSIDGGADSALFDIDPGSGDLTFKTAPVFATKADADTNGVYEVTVKVDDGNGGTDTQAVSVTVTEKDVNDPPMITSNGGGDTANVDAEEMQTSVTTVTATDPDLPANILTFMITGGADADLFNLDAGSGVLTFKTPPILGTNNDANGDGVYEVTVKVSDGIDGSDSQDISVTVIMKIVDEDDYDAYANGSGSPFPPEATAQDKDINKDYDGDGQTNGEEFAAGTDPTDPNDNFWSMASYDPVEGFKVIFSPYLPEKNEYTLVNAFGGSNNNESTPLELSPIPYEGDSSLGCFIVPPSSGPLENLLLFINTLKTTL